MREKPLVDRVDVVIGEKDDERVITVAKATADRWPDLYRPVETKTGRKTAAAKRAKDQRDDDATPTSADDLPVAASTTAATASAATTAGTSGVTTEGVTS